ncbi:MAG TPA: hypothetical protein V6C57_00900 [Coleofasciculaceae cyanobacterium]
MELTQWLSTPWFDWIAAGLAISLLVSSFLMVCIVVLTRGTQRNQQ